MKLPEAFQHRMKELLGEEYEAFEASYDKTSACGLRVNTLKVTPEQFQACCPFPIEPIPWISKGFYYHQEDQPAKHPYYYAGLYYIQEPSAMTPASFLPVEPGQKVLDLCAAPGGKSTELAAKLCGQGVLVANDISNSRAKALLKNIELSGVRNAIVSSETPARLAEVFEGYFDRILVDAPCSGEGMFRKSPAVMKNWEQYGVDYYHRLQTEILPFAVTMLRPGGLLLYSTCTFSPKEDEGTVAWLLERYPELSVIPAAVSYEGFAPGHPEWLASEPSYMHFIEKHPQRVREIANTVRLWPHKLKGEGHFIALFQKNGDRDANAEGTTRYSNEKISVQAEQFLKQLRYPLEKSRILIREDRLYLIPEGLPELNGLRILRSGLLLGEQKKGRFEPSQALACALNPNDYDNCYEIPSKDGDVIRYLKCESIELKRSCQDGYVLVTTDGWPLGWGKVKNGSFKNKYLSGWRMM